MYTETRHHSFRFSLKLNIVSQFISLTIFYISLSVGPGSPMVIILATGSKVRGYKPGGGRWIFSERKNPEYDFLRKGSKAVDPVSQIYGS